MRAFVPAPLPPVPALKLVGGGLDARQASERLIAEWQSTVADADEGPVFWLSLAMMQWTLGRLLPHVLERALQVIDSGSDLGRWRETPQFAKRKSVLVALRDKLVSQPPAANRAPKKFRSSTDRAIGSMHAYELTSTACCLFRVIGYHSDKGGRSPVAELLDWVGNELPSAEVIQKLPVRIRMSPNGERTSQFLLGAASKRDSPGSRIRSLDISSKPSQDVGGYVCFLWRYLDRQLLSEFGIGGESG